MSLFKPMDPLFKICVQESLGRQEVMRTLGIEITRLEPREIALTMPYAAAYTPQHGFVHAGIVATALDNACGGAAFYGGLGLDMLGNCLVIEEMARAHIAYFYTYSMNVHIASKGIELHGTEAQRQRWLPRLASGRALGCYALTEEGAGSDAAALRTTAERRGDSYVLNGAKRYITNAPVAGVFRFFAGHPDAGASPKISAFVVEKGSRASASARSSRWPAGVALSIPRSSSRTCPCPSITSSARKAKALPSPCNVSMPAASIGRPIASGPRSSCWGRRPLTPRDGSNSASRSPETRASNGCSPTWRPTCMRHGSPVTKRLGGTISSRCIAQASRRWPS
jgi:hypothetical protein